MLMMRPTVAEGGRLCALHGQDCQHFPEEAPSHIFIQEFKLICKSNNVF